MKSLVSWRLILFPVILIVLCGPAVWAAPQRIVSSGPAVTEKLYLLGAGASIVGVTVNCVRPEGARQKEKIGSVTQTNLEKVLSLKPDLVIATSLTDPKAVKKMKDLGMHVMVIKEPKSFDEMNAQFMTLGKVTGREKEASRIVAEAENKVKLIREKTGRLPKKKVFLQIGASPLFTATKDSFLSNFIDFSGGINVAGASKGGFYSREQVVKDNPDVIIIAAMEGAVAEKERKTWEKFASIDAIKHGAVYIMDPYKMCSPTPVTFVEALDEMARLLHGGLYGRKK